MRLIDADKLLELIKEQKEREIGGYTKGINAGLNIAKSIINDKTQTPTAYDVDKVVERLEKKIQTHECCMEYEKKNGTITEEFQQRKAVEVLKGAIEIVKGGGVNG
jgi:hypothetical protein|nr:MAG TPA: hypothetical protein [Bacteriophage sp.]DAZ47382.1 MAG TPA: hypothetical protein [Caudoviricetes sp.]